MILRGFFVFECSMLSRSMSRNSKSDGEDTSYRNLRMWDAAVYSALGYTTKSN